MAVTEPSALDVARLQKDFPILATEIDGKRLVYLDSASSSQKPTVVLDAMNRYYETTHANVHRGVYRIAEEATRLFEEARGKVATFIGAGSPAEVVFTKNVTEALNLVAYSWGRANLAAGDVVVLTEMEHHANLVPWLALKAERGIELRYLPVGDDGLLDLSDLDRALDGARLLAFTAMSNVLGTINPIRLLTDAAHAAGAVALVDGAQHAPHLPTDVAEMGCDLFGFTGHKVLGPTGIGCLWGPTRAARSHATVPRGRRDDPRRTARRVHHERRPLEVRGRDPADRRGHRAGRSHRLSDRRRPANHPRP